MITFGQSRVDGVLYAESMNMRCYAISQAGMLDMLQHTIRDYQHIDLVMFGMFSRYPTFKLDPLHSLTSDNSDTCDVSTNGPWATNGPWLDQWARNMYQKNQYVFDSFLSSLSIHDKGVVGRVQLFRLILMYTTGSFYPRVHPSGKSSPKPVVRPWPGFNKFK